MNRNGADLLCDALLAHEVDVCFANPGTSEMHFVAALDRKPQMRCVLGLFEGVVTGAADGYGRMADKPAATLLHLGPGLANGLANLHNARRASTPIVNIVGDHATHHLAYDAPLTSDIESLARPMSQWYGRIGSTGAIWEQTARACSAAVSTPGVAVLVLPADVAWNESAATTGIVEAPSPRPRVDSAAIENAARQIRQARRPVILVGGPALRERPLGLLDAIARKTGALLLAENSSGRTERGRGRAAPVKVPYRIDAAVELFAGTDLVVLIGAVPPSAFFAYPGKPSHPLPEGCTVVALAGRGQDVVGAIEELAEGVGAGPAAFANGERAPEMPSLAMAFNGQSISRLVAAMMPENAIVCDESLTGGAAFHASSANAAPHDYLELTGGAIGIGIPMATGAAVACPDRKVLSLQADGSGMYTVQALWTQARERLDIVTVVFSNRAYSVLHAEMRNVGVESPGYNARRMLNLDDPTISWVDLARGMGVEGTAVSSLAALQSALEHAFSTRGPFLIEAQL